MATQLHPLALLRLLRSDRLSARYFETDKLVEDHLNFSETLANLANDDLLNNPWTWDAGEILEENLDHGFNHIRRIEKWYKLFYEKDKSLRSDIYSLYFTPSVYMADRFHDLIEVTTKRKTGHDIAAALLALGYLSSLTKFLTGTGAREIPIDDWEKIIWGTTFICHHHSRPESSLKSVTPDQLKDGDILNPQQMLEATKEMARKADHSDIYTFFPAFNLIKETVTEIEEGKFRHSPWFSKNELREMIQVDTEQAPLMVDEIYEREKREIEGLVKQAFLFSAADKLDGLFPDDLSTSRTTLTRPERDFYVRTAEQFDSLEKEFNHRVEDGGGPESSCDFNRLLFEISRVGTYEGISGWLSYIYSYLLEEKGRHMLKVIPAFIEGSFWPYMDAYDNLERDTIRALLVKSGVSALDAKMVSTERREFMISETGRLLSQRGYSRKLLDRLLEKIGDEKYDVSGALIGKYDKLQGINFTDKDRDHILELLNLAISIQKSKLIKYHGSLDGVPPYSSYYAINLDDYKVDLGE